MAVLLKIFAPRQIRALKIMLASLLAAIEMFSSAIFDTPQTPRGAHVDMSKFELAWSDEFNTGVFDTTKWDGHYCYGNNTIARGGGFFNRQQTSFKDGNLIIRSGYRADGPGGPGYYSYGMDSRRGLYEQLYGYFEIRCILPKGEGLNAAFWMMNDNMGNVDGSGKDGVELDIFEAPYFKDTNYMHNTITSNIHYDGYAEAHKHEAVGDFYVNKPYDEYNTYGLEWNKDEYIFYINGVESARSSFGGACQVPLYLILTVCVSGGSSDGITPVVEADWAGDIRKNNLLPSDFIVDYVRAYQYK